MSILKNNTKDFCCNDLKHFTREDYIIEYEPIDRSFVIIYAKGRCTGIEFCPFCGTKLPETLNSKIFEVIEKEYGIPMGEADIFEFTNLPDEFRTDEWWKKRGL